MASWMIHLRVADMLLDQIPRLCAAEFVMGNIAPDSGVPNEDWSVFSPNTDVSHFKRPGSDGKKDLDIQAYIEKYFSVSHQQNYDDKQFSFYLGYLTHLLTDVQWSLRIARPTLEKYNAEAVLDRQRFIWKIKEDWYDLDHLYLKEHPNFRAFQIYSNCVGFVNRFMDIFSTDAFDNRRQYIANFYRQGSERDLDREYVFLTKAEADSFTAECASNILQQLRNIIVKS